MRLKVPAEQLVQATAPLAETVPAAQGVQLETAVKVPAAHTVHADLPAKETEPTAQFLHELALAGEKVPARHGVQLDAPRVEFPTVTMVLNVPAAHAEHVVRSRVLA